MKKTGFRTTREKKLLTYIACVGVISVFVWLVASSTVSAAVGQKVRLIPESFSEVAEKISPAVVNVRTETVTTQTDRMFRHYFGSPFGPNDPLNDFFERFFNAPHERHFKQRSLGSGFIIDPKGIIVTNNHVVENADKITVKLKNGEEYEVKKVHTDPKTDIAILEIDPDHALPSVPLGDSDSLKVGEWVIAIGSPFGLEQTVTAGIVSAKGRVIGAGPYDDFIQTDASINPGNSGGPLVNMKGEVVGINTAIIAGGQGIGFAIPSNLAKNIIRQLETKGYVERGWLGVGIQPVSKEMAEYYGLREGRGALVSKVFPGDPADKAGIKPGDIILEVDGKKIDDSHDLSTMIANIPAGKTVKILLIRNGKKKTVKVKITKRNDEQISAKAGGEAGAEVSALDVTVANITDDVARRLNLDSTEGVYVSEVKEGGRGDMLGLMRGDVIKEINHKRIKNIDDYKKVMASIKEGDRLQLLIRKVNGIYMLIDTTR